MVETRQGLEILAFPDPGVWRAWLHANGTTSPGIWLRIYKKASGHPTVTYAEALDEALCYGWIDSTKNAYDDASFLQRFGPRKPRSVWSQINRDHVARLIAAGKMHDRGHAAIEAAKANGQWEAAYAPQSAASVPEDLQALLDAHPDARTFFEGLNRANRYALLYRIQGARKPETRAKRLQWALDLLLKRQTVHPQAEG